MNESPCRDCGYPLYRTALICKDCGRLNVVQRWGNGFSVGRLHFFRWRDRQGLRALVTAWRIGDVRRLTHVPIVGTRYTFFWGGRT